jgi:hypothetical protein
MTGPARSGATAPGSGRALAVLAAASPLTLAAQLLPGAVSDLLLAALTGVLPAALMALGAGSSSGPVSGPMSDGPVSGPMSERWRWLFPGLGALLAAAAVSVLALSRAAGEAGAATGLPPATVVQIVGLWLLPLPLATLGYALTFDRAGVRPEALDALRRRFPRAD